MTKKKNIHIYHGDKILLSIITMKTGRKNCERIAVIPNLWLKS